MLTWLICDGASLGNPELEQKRGVQHTDSEFVAILQGKVQISWQLHFRKLRYEIGRRSTLGALTDRYSRDRWLHLDAYIDGLKDF